MPAASLALREGGVVVAPLGRAPERRRAEEHGGGYIACARCRSAVSDPTSRVSVAGAHAHTFSNPAGVEFTIGCFRTARGVRAGGPATGEHTWFPGYAWQVGYCSTCRTHLGWRFSGPEPFYGLVLDRLVDRR